MWSCCSKEQKSMEWYEFTHSFASCFTAYQASKLWLVSKNFVSINSCESDEEKKNGKKVCFACKYRTIK